MRGNFLLVSALLLQGLAGAQVDITTEAQNPLIQNLRLEPEVFDFRYAPERWQASICLQDDPHKSIVGSDGALYYDFGRGPMHQFSTRVKGLLEGAGAMRRTGQRLQGPRVPVVETVHRAGALSLTSRAWAGAPATDHVETWKDRRHDYLWLTLKNEGDAPAGGRLAVRIDSSRRLTLDKEGRANRLVDRRNPKQVFCRIWPAPEAVEEPGEAGIEALEELSISRDWAHPVSKCDSRFKHIMVGYKHPLIFQFAGDPGRTYRAAFGLIEGWHDGPGQRPLEIHIEGKSVRTVDPIKEHGKNRPFVLFFDVMDENGDGVIELGVHAPGSTVDDNTILTALWIFDPEDAPDESAILEGGVDGRALAVVDADRAVVNRPFFVRFPERMLQPGESFEALLALHLGQEAEPRAKSVEDAAKERERAVSYWKGLDLPYDRIRIPDAGMQGLLDSCIRNIYQARELRDGRPAFQVGPTHYRGMWAADGPFILEAITYLGRVEEARPGLEMLAEGDEGPQGVGFSKKSGLRLWMIWRHYQLTGDIEWLKKMWPKVRDEVERIKEYREMTRDEPDAMNHGLMPVGFGDGGLGGMHREYTNVYWNLSGFSAACKIAGRLGRSGELPAWEEEYQDFFETFDRARRRDQLVDAFGNTYVPVTMKGEAAQLPQRGAWSFLHSVYPGGIYGSDDALMLGTMAMLSAVEAEGLIHGTGWIPDGIWNYAASFYGHAHLWLGHGRKAASILYAFANHACPLLCWREEQNVKGDAERYVGDMPHNWASAEFIRMIRHALILERGGVLHLLEGMPRTWTRPGCEIRLDKIPTSFGEMSLGLRVHKDGDSAELTVRLPGREPPERVHVHLEHFARRIRDQMMEPFEGEPLDKGRLPAGFILKIRLGEKGN